ncbi:MAG: DUF4403 family protein [Bacteroidales bacterium]
MKNFSSKFIIAAIAIFMFSCKSNQIIEKPTESYLPSTISPALSELPLQVEIDVKKLEVGINKKMNGLIFEGSNLADKDLQVKVWKAQNFTFSINGNVIEYRVPLKVWTRFAWSITKLGFTVSDNYEANGAIALTYKTTISLDKNWKLVSKTASSGFQWIETPKLSVIGVNVPVTPVANLALSRCDKLISEQIDKSLAEAVDLKKYVSQAWGEMQKPMMISPENQMWLRVTPRDIYVSPFSTVGNKLNLSIALYSQIESIIGAQPKKNPMVLLPDMKYISRAPQQFNLNLAADVTFDKISEMAKKQLVNKTFADGNKKITITDLSIFGSEGKAVFVADVIGSIKGKIYFTGNMVYNKEKNALEIAQPQFELKTNNFLLKSAAWLAHGIILSKIMPYLTYPLQEDLDKIKNESNKMLSNYTVYGGMALQGKLNQVNVTSFSLVPGAVRVMATVKGNVALKVQDIQF